MIKPEDSEVAKIREKIRESTEQSKTVVVSAAQSSGNVAARWWSGLTSSTRVASIAAGAGIVGGFVLGVFVGRPKSDNKTAPTSTPTGSAPPEPRTPTGGTLAVDTRSSLPAALRSRAGKTSAVLGTVQNGDVVAVLGSSDVGATTWYRVRASDGQVGWIHGGILR